MTIIFTEEAWEFARQQAREITITQARCRGWGGHIRISPAVSVGIPENINDFTVYSKEDVNIYVARDFPDNPPNLILQLKKTRGKPPALAGSRRH